MSDDAGGHKLNRRKLLGTSVKAGAAALIPLVHTGCSTVQPPVQSPLGASNDAVLAAFADRIMPADDSGPAASACGVVTYINRSLADWNRSELPVLAAGLQALDAAALARHSQGFAVIDTDKQDALLIALEAGELTDVALGQQLFNRLHRLVLEGMFSDPYYGGNADFAGWDLIGYPGAVLSSSGDMQKMWTRLPLLHTSAYGAEHDGH